MRHFLGQIGLDQDAIPIKRANASLSLVALKALYCYRRLRMANDFDIGHNSSRAAYIAAVAQIRGPTFTLHPEIEERIVADKEYLPITGLAEFNKNAAKLAYGEDSTPLKESSVSCVLHVCLKKLLLSWRE